MTLNGAVKAQELELVGMLYYHQPFGGSSQQQNKSKVGVAFNYQDVSTSALIKNHFSHINLLEQKLPPLFNFEMGGKGVEYSKVFNLFSNPIVFPLLGDFTKYLHGVITFKDNSKNKLAVCDVGAGTGYFSKTLYDANPTIELTLIEPSLDMLKILKKRYKDNNVCIVNKTWDKAVGEIDKQDIFIFQRSLYAFSGNIEDYKLIIQQVYSKLNKEGIVAVFEFDHKMDIKAMLQHLDQNQDNLQYDERPYQETRAIFAEHLERFNQGVDNGEFTLFSQKKMQEVFEAGGFIPVFRKDNYCFFKKIW